MLAPIAPGARRSCRVRHDRVVFGRSRGKQSALSHASHTGASDADLLPLLFVPRSVKRLVDGTADEKCLKRCQLAHNCRCGGDLRVEGADHAPCPAVFSSVGALIWSSPGATSISRFKRHLSKNVPPPARGARERRPRSGAIVC